jgi:hypothetical protein
MSHANTADKLLIKPAAGARPAPPRTRGQIIPKARTTASHPPSHTRHDEHQAGNHPQTDQPPESYRPPNVLRLLMCGLVVSRP